MKIIFLLGAAFSVYMFYALVSIHDEFLSWWNVLNLILLIVTFLCAWGLWKRKHWALFLSLFLAVAAFGFGILATLSSTGLALFLMVTVAGVLYALRRRPVGTTIVISLLGMLAVLLVVAFGFTATTANLFSTLSSGKLGSNSFENRVAADAVSIGIVGETYGLGAGLGSTRSSSLFASLPANIGLVGAAIFGVLVYRAISFRSTDVVEWQARWGLLALLAAAALAVPDISLTLLWVAIALATPGRSAAMPAREDRHPVSTAWIRT